MVAITYIRLTIVTRERVFNLRENSKVVLNIFFNEKLNIYEANIITRDTRENIFMTSGILMLNVPVP